MRERPPENGPHLRNQAFQGGRSRDHSLQEGGVPLVAQRGQLRASGPSFVALGWRNPNLAPSSCANPVRLHGTERQLAHPRTFPCPTYFQINERQFMMWPLGTLLIRSNALTLPPSRIDTQETRLVRPVQMTLIHGQIGIRWRVQPND